MSEISCPLKNSWKLRWRKARNVAERLSVSGELSGAWFSVVLGESATFNHTCDAGEMTTMRPRRAGLGTGHGSIMNL